MVRPLVRAGRKHGPPAALPSSFGRPAARVVATRVCSFGDGQPLRGLNARRLEPFRHTGGAHNSWPLRCGHACSRSGWLALRRHHACSEAGRWPVRRGARDGRRTLRSGTRDGRPPRSGSRGGWPLRRRPSHGHSRGQPPRRRRALTTQPFHPHPNPSPNPNPIPNPNPHPHPHLVPQP